MSRWAVLLFLAVASLASAELQRVATLDLPGLDPGDLVVDLASQDLVIRECDDDELTFLAPTFDPAAGTFSFELSDPIASTADFLQDCQLFYDPGTRMIHYVSQRSRSSDPFGMNYEQVFVVTRRNRQFVGSFLINPNGEDPPAAPVDFRFVINGVGFKPANVDGNPNARLIIDDTVKGNLHVIDVDEFGGVASNTAFSYKPRYENGCEWPDIDPGPTYSCSLNTADGSGLALDWARTPDQLFMADHLFNSFLVRRFAVDEAAPGTPVEGANINIGNAPVSFGIGAQGLEALPGENRILVLTAAQSFDDGLIIDIDSETFALDSILFDFRDLRSVAVDPADRGHFFVPVQDFGGGPLLVREFMGRTEVDSTTVDSDFSAGFNEVHAAYDPELKLLYIAQNDRIDVFSTGAPEGPFPNPDRDATTAGAPLNIGAGDRFGGAVALDGHLVAVGAPADVDGPNTGSVTIYRREGNALLRETVLTTPPGFGAAGFGAALALQGNRLVIGAPGDANAKAKGLTPLQAAIFERTQQGWDFKAPIQPDESQPGDGFGTAVALDGDRIVAGAPGADNDTGMVFLFDFDNNVATQMDQAVPPGAQAGDRVGATVSIKGGRIAAGAPGSRVGAAVAGSATLFDTVAGNLTARGTVVGEPGDEFGTSVGLDGTVMVVGSPGADGSMGADEGEAAVFGLIGDLTRIGTLSANDPIAGARFGSSVSADRELIAIGAPGASNALANSGAGYLFAAGGNRALLEKLEADTAVEDFGQAVAVSGRNVMIGAPATSADTGAARFFLEVEEIWRSGFE